MHCVLRLFSFNFSLKFLSTSLSCFVRPGNIILLKISSVELLRLLTFYMTCHFVAVSFILIIIGRGFGLDVGLFPWSDSPPFILPRELRRPSLFISTISSFWMFILDAANKSLQKHSLCWPLSSSDSFTLKTIKLFFFCSFIYLFFLPPILS